jgi:hypothetical protein
MNGSLTMTLRIAAAALLVSIAAGPAAAQSSPSARRWQVEGFAGLSVFDLPSDGTASLPPAGPGLITSGPTNPSRRVSTWFLGDGASLLNGVNAEFGIPGRIAPLDSALAAFGLTGANAPAFGIRVRRIVSQRLTIEFSADMMSGSRELSPEFLEAVEAARASFITAFNGLLTTGPFTTPSVTATSTVSNQSSRDLATTVSAQWTFSAGAFAPYVAAGGGLVHKVGDLPSVTLNGNYRFDILGGFPINETDDLRLRYDQGSALVGLVGAGLRRNFSERAGLSLDARLLFGQQTLTLRLDSNPAVVTGTPAGFIESFTTPAIQFSNSPATGRESTLSGEPLDGFKAFSTSGLQTRYIVSAGVFWRF